MARDKITNATRLLPALAVLLAWPAAATEIFKWIDDDGVIHYSDVAPEDTDDFRRLVVHDRNPPDYDPATDPNSIRNQAERINDTWSKLESERDRRLEAREEERREAEERAREEQRFYAQYARPYYWGGGFRPVRPVHPIYPPERPPHRPPYRPPVYPPRPMVKPTSEWVDPFRSAHIGVRKNTGR